MEKWIKLALEMGFTEAAPLDPATLRPLESVRAYCAEEKCGYYGKSWACPPACGSLEDCAARMHAFPKGVLLVTQAHREDESSFDEIIAVSRRHKTRHYAFAEKMQAALPRVLALGSGGCSLCETCTYPDAPCRHPDRMVSSLEACGLQVADVCRDCGIAYHYSGKTITLASACLFEE